MSSTARAIISPRPPVAALRRTRARRAQARRLGPRAHCARASGAAPYWHWLFFMDVRGRLWGTCVHIIIHWAPRAHEGVGEPEAGGGPSCGGGGLRKGCQTKKKKRFPAQLYCSSLQSPMPGETRTFFCCAKAVHDEANSFALRRTDPINNNISLASPWGPVFFVEVLFATFARKTGTRAKPGHAPNRDRRQTGTRAKPGHAQNRDRRQTGTRAKPVIRLGASHHRHHY